MGDMSVFSSSRHEEERRLQPTQPSVPHTVVAEGVRVEGDFKGQGDIVIDGEVKGKISTDCKLSIGPNANVEADVHAESAVISGKVLGNIIVRSHVEIQATANVQGNVTSGTVTIESGARLSGKVSIGGGGNGSVTLEKDETDQNVSNSEVEEGHVITE